MMLIFNTIILTTLFIMMKHPLSMGIILMMQTVYMTIIMGYFMKSFWFSYIMFLMIMGGGLILFMYMASTASNEKMTISWKLLIFMMIMEFMSLMLNQMLPIKSLVEIKHPLNSMIPYDQTMSLIKMFSWSYMSLTIMMISYLFLTMIIVSYIIKTYEGPMKMKKY